MQLVFSIFEPESGGCFPDPLLARPPIRRRWQVFLRFFPVRRSQLRGSVAFSVEGSKSEKAFKEVIMKNSPISKLFVGRIAPARRSKASHRLSAYSRLLKSAAITMIVAGLSAAHALTPAGPNRPATVPADYVITPFGYFHPSCVSQLAQGDVVRQDQNAIGHADGTYDSIPVCAHARYGTDGKTIAKDEAAVKQPTISHAWVEYASTQTTSSYGALQAVWVVPPAPQTNHGQTVYLFPGMEDYQDVVTIIQPVLGWNSDFASAWGIASWNCCKSGTVFESQPTRVNAGDTIIGSVFQGCAAGTLSCPTWNILAYDETSGKQSQLVTSSYGQTFNWAFAGALEVYNISQCSDYPGSTIVLGQTFYGLILDDYKDVQIANPAWSVTNASSGLTPQCGYGGSLSQQVVLSYN
jgi:hypothetical protein